MDQRKKDATEEHLEIGAAGGPSRKTRHGHGPAETSSATKTHRVPSTPASPTNLPSSKGVLGAAGAQPASSALTSTLTASEKVDEKELERREKEKRKKEKRKKKKEQEEGEEEGDKGAGGGNVSSTSNPDLKGDEELAKQLAFNEESLEELKKDFGESGSSDDEDSWVDVPPARSRPLPEGPDSKSQKSLSGIDFSAFASLGTSASSISSPLRRSSPLPSSVGGDLRA